MIQWKQKAHQEGVYGEVYMDDLFIYYIFQVSNYFLSMTATWYGKTPNKQVESLLEIKPKLHQLLALPQFSQELKAYNPKLLDYITNNSWLISEAVCYLTAEPQPNDSNDRKYKLPLQVIQMIQTETTCILNGFFKQGQYKQLLNFDLLFSMLQQNQILPLLAGYFFRTNLCLLNNRYKDTIERIYAKPKIFNSLINHTEHMSISNTIQLFLNLDINKSAAGHQEKLNVKSDVIRSIMKKIQIENRIRSYKSPAIIQNLCSILIQAIDKYYLIIDGKPMIESIVDQSSIQVMMVLIKQNSEMALSAFGFFISLINYYSFSSFNSEQQNNAQMARKNAERLQSQPMINELVSYLPFALDKIMHAHKIDLYHYRLLEVYCHCISISSIKVFKKICETSFFSCLITLLFKHQNNNILHMLIEKSFYHVFINQRKIYQDYKKHLFCEIDIIDITVNRILKLFKDDNFLNQAKSKSYFGHFMRILKIYSGIQPTDQKIISVIKSKTNAWNKISQLLIKPYQGICFKQLGSYQNIPNPIYQEFTVKKDSNISNTSPSISKNNSTILQIQKEEHFPMPNATQSHEKKQQLNSHSYLFDHEPQKLPGKLENSNMMMLEQKDLKKTQSYKDFMSKRKVQAEHELKLKRSLSQDKKLSNNSRGKMTSPSPNKKNNWKEKDQKQLDLTNSQSSKEYHSPTPKIPISRRNNIGNPVNITASEHEKRPLEKKMAQQQRRSSKSLNMQQIKKIKVIQIDPPREKKFRKAQEKDRLLLDFLGIQV